MAKEAMASLEAGHPAIIFLDVALLRSDAIDVIRGLSERRYGGLVQLMSGGRPSLLEAIQRIGVRHGMKLAPPLNKPVTREAIVQVVEGLRSPAILSAGGRRGRRRAMSSVDPLSIRDAKNDARSDGAAARAKIDCRRSPWRRTMTRRSQPAHHGCCAAPGRFYARCRSSTSIEIMRVLPLEPLAGRAGLCSRPQHHSRCTGAGRRCRARRRRPGHGILAAGRNQGGDEDNRAGGRRGSSAFPTIAAGAFDELPPLLQDAAADTIAAIGARDGEFLVVLRTGRLVPRGRVRSS